MSANSITISGNMGGPAELRFTSSGKATWSFRLAFTPRRKDGDQWVDSGPTLWFGVTVWGDTGADLADRYGETVGVATVSGRLSSRSWTNRDGQDVTEMTITADAVTIAPRGPKGTRTGERHASKPQQADPWGNTEAPPF